MTLSTFLWRNFVPLYFTLAFLYAQLKTTVWSISKPWLFFRHFVGNFQLFVGSLSCCKFQPSFSCQIDGLTFDSWILWYTEEFMANSMTGKCPGPVAAKQAHIKPNAWRWYNGVIADVSGFCQTWHCVLWQNFSFFVFIGPKDIATHLQIPAWKSS